MKNLIEEIQRAKKLMGISEGLDLPKTKSDGIYLLYYELYNFGGDANRASIRPMVFDVITNEQDNDKLLNQIIHNEVGHYHDRQHNITPDKSPYKNRDVKYNTKVNPDLIKLMISVNDDYSKTHYKTQNIKISGNHGQKCFKILEYLEHEGLIVINGSWGFLLKPSSESVKNFIREYNNQVMSIFHH